MKPELVKYRLERAEESLEDAEFLISGSRVKAALNRVYYSLFYAVTALLETQDYSSSKHSGVRALFNQHFVKTGAVSEQTGELYNELFKDRNKGDYADFADFPIEKVHKYYDDCRKSVSEIRKIIHETMEWSLNGK